MNKHIKLKQWVWFIGLWLAGFITMSAIAYPIKWFLKSIG